MRGEHSFDATGDLTVKGSSPHARGAHGDWSDWYYEQGIIPACAGSTREQHRRDTRTGDHPRMRGEHSCHVVVDAQESGSSPHARGAHFTTGASGKHFRLMHSLFASSGHPNGPSSDYIFARRDTC